MELIQETLIQALDNYRKSLHVLGYKNNIDVASLIILSFIEECLYKYFPGEVSEDDYRELTKTVYKLADSTSLINYPSFKVYNELVRNYNDDIKFILNEDNTLRL